MIYALEGASTLADALTNFQSILTSVIGVIESNPIFLTGLVVPLIGAGVGMVKRIV